MAQYVNSIIHRHPTRLCILIFHPVDIAFSLAWFAAFGTLVNALEATTCGQDITNLECTQWKVNEAFTFLSAIVWLITGMVGLFYVWRAE